MAEINTFSGSGTQTQINQQPATNSDTKTVQNPRYQLILPPGGMNQSSEAALIQLLESYAPFFEKGTLKVTIARNGPKPSSLEGRALYSITVSCNQKFNEGPLTETRGYKTDVSYVDTDTEYTTYLSDENHFYEIVKSDHETRYYENNHPETEYDVIEALRNILDRFSPKRDRSFCNEIGEMSTGDEKDAADCAYALNVKYNVEKYVVRYVPVRWWFDKYIVEQKR